MAAPDAWRQLLPQLAGLPLLPIGTGSNGKAPAHPQTGALLTGWTSAAFTPEEVATAHSSIGAVGFRPGPDAGDLIAFDIDGPTAVAYCRSHPGCDPLDAPTWQVRRDTDADRLKVIWRIPADLRDHLQLTVSKHQTKPPSARGAGDGENVATYFGSGQVVVLGQHISSSGNYFWPDGRGPAAVAEITPEWWALALEVAEQARSNKGSSTAGKGTSKAGDWRRITTRCPICGRDRQHACQIHRDGQSILCYIGSSFQPPALKPGEVMPGSDGQQWAYTGPKECWGEFAHFRIDRPRPSRCDSPAEPRSSPGGDGVEEPPRSDAQPYTVLGWNAERNAVWYRHHGTAQIATIKPSGQPELLKLAPLDHWRDRYPRTNKEGEITGIHWGTAASDLIEAANVAGVFQEAEMRGRGVWLDAGHVVWHLGDRLEVDGERVPLAEHRSRKHYRLMPALELDTQAAPLTDEHGAVILQVLRDCGWVGASDHLHLAGFCVLSNVGGALPKRPGLQITSPFGSGKTDTIDNVIVPLQGGIGLLSSGSTEAGVRQLLGIDTLPATIDESEAEDGKRREAQLRLVRYSYDGKPVIKGTPGGEAMTFCLRSSLALAGINSPIDNPADRSRIAVISRKNLPEADWAAVAQRRAEAITAEIGQRLIRRTVSTLPALLANVATFAKVISSKITTGDAGRTGDTWGALLAGAHHLVSTAALNEAAAVAWLDSVGWDLSHTDADEQDRRAGAEGRQCLDHLLSHRVQWREAFDPDAGRPSTGVLSVRELVSIARMQHFCAERDEAEKALGRLGLRAMPDGLAVANKDPGIAPIFASTKWAKDAHKARLLELDGAARTSGPLHFPSNASRRAVLVPWQIVGDLGEAA